MQIKVEIMEHIIHYHSEYFDVIHSMNKEINYSQHNHFSSYTLGIVLDGRVTLNYENQILNYCSNSFFVIKPYQMHALFLPHQYDLISLSINKILLTKYSAKELTDIFSEALFHLNIDFRFAILVDAVNALYTLEINDIIDLNIMTQAGILRNKPEECTFLNELADNSGYSKYHFIKRFKRFIGLTPHQFQIQNKVRKAQKMIESGMPISTIANDLGFYDQSHFNKNFKRIVGMTPIEYKKATEPISVNRVNKEQE